LDAHLEELQQSLLSGNVTVGNYHYFKIRDPKERTICAASFSERVLHHAVMNLCEPILERASVSDSYACRKGKGRLAAVERAQQYACQYRWFLKLDVRKYFDSIHHETLRGLLRGTFKDPAVLVLFDAIIDSYQTAPRRGLPIGNLTSQHFANFYLAPLDRFIKERLQRRAFVRYMDDFVVWGDSAQELRDVRNQVREFLATELHLELKPNMIINRTELGMDFLGYRIFPDKVRLARRSKVRFARKFRRYEQAYLRGEWAELQLQQRVQALLSFVMPADSRDYRLHVLKRFGVVAHGLEPRDSRRQLEQQRVELPGGEPQQQLAGQQEQQPRVPVRPAPSSTSVPEGAKADPAAILSCGDNQPQANSRKEPPGVSSQNGVSVESSGRICVSSPIPGTDL
jgi:hypothetical protein